MAATKSKSTTRVVVKTPRTERTIALRGVSAAQTIRALHEAFGDRLENAEDAPVDVTETAWHRRVATGMTPGKLLRIYRERAGWSQAELGRRLGAASRQYVSGMERGDRGISKAMARQLAELFDVSAERFI